jgi:hypothetical protein
MIVPGCPAGRDSSSPCACSPACSEDYSWRSSSPRTKPAAFFGNNVHLADAQSFAAYLAPLRKAE